MFRKVGGKKYCLLWIFLAVVGFYYYLARHVRARKPSDGMHAFNHPDPTPLPGPNSWVLVQANGTMDPCVRVAMAFPGWTVLVSGHSKPINSHSRCMYINEVPMTQEVGPPSELFSSQFRAFLFSIKHGAEVIYVPPSHQRWDSLEHPHNMVSTSTTFSLLYHAASGHFDAEAHFGCRLRTGLGSTAAEYKLCKMKTPALQVLAALPHSGPTEQVEDLEPCAIDAGSMCDPRAPKVVLRQGTVAHFHFEGALYHSQAFWAFPFFRLEKETSTPVPAIWSVLVQRLLWFSGNRVSVHFDPLHPSPARSVRKQDLQLHSKLPMPECTPDMLEDCLRHYVDNVAKALPDAKHLPQMLDVWIELLKDAGYLFQGSEPPASDQCNDQVVFNPIHLTDELHMVKRRRCPLLPITNIKENQMMFESICSKFAPPQVPVTLSEPWEQFDDILLIVTFNNPFYQLIPYIETLYRSLFPYLIYCGPKAPNAAKYPNLKNYNFTFLSYGSNPEKHFPGAFSYVCLDMAFTMGYRVKGYLTISDDLFVNVHAIKKLDKSAMWFLPRNEIRVGNILTLRECRLGMCDFHTHWHWWEDYKQEAISMLSRLKAEQYHSLLLKQCHNNLVRRNGAELRPNGGYSDIYYIPQHLAQDFAELSRMFRRENVFLEIAVPTIITCLDSVGNIMPLYGVDIDVEEYRNSPWHYFTPQEMLGKAYLHPVKWSGLLKNSVDHAELLCSKLLPWMHDPYNRMPK